MLIMTAMIAMLQQLVGAGCCSAAVQLIACRLVAQWLVAQMLAALWHPTPPVGVLSAMHISSLTPDP